MGGGSWTQHEFASYSRATKSGFDIDTTRAIVGDEQLTKVSRMHEKLNPYEVTRECRDSAEHPNTVPIILALDVTGSMGRASIEVASELGNIVDSIKQVIPDAEIMVMGIGDFYIDDAPLQVGQFESDIRIAEQLDLIYHEHGGGGNDFESYTAAWAFGTYSCKLDCWERGQKGIIITMGDEFINPYIDPIEYKRKTGCDMKKDDLLTPNLYIEASQKFNLYHINVIHGYRNCSTDKWVEVLGKENVFNSAVQDIKDTIIKIIGNAASNNSVNAINDNAVLVDENGAIGW